MGFGLSTVKSVSSVAIPTDRAAVLEEAEAETPQYELPLREKQYEFVTSDIHSMAIIGGIGSGKTYSLDAFVAFKMAQEAGTGTLGGIFANTYQQLEQATLPGLWAMFEAMGMEEGRDYVYNVRPPRSWGDFHTRFKKHNGVLSVRRWGQALVRSLERFNSVRGVEFGWIAVDELRDASLEAFNVVLGRLRCKKARSRQARFVTSPNGLDWIYTEFVERVEKGEFPDGSRVCLRMTTRENQANLPGEYITTLENSYDAKFARQELGGEFISLTSGAVYHQFNRLKHIREVHRPNPNLDACVSFDFNRNPFCVTIYQAFPLKGYGTGLQMLDEVRLEDADTEAACLEVFDRLARLGIDKAMIRVYGDPAGSQRSTKSNLSDYDLITRAFTARYGNRFVKSWLRAHRPVLEGVHAVNGAFCNVEGHARLWVHPRCTHSVRDFERVIYKPGTREIKKDGDYKMFTHLSDTVRYIVEQLFPLRKAQGGRIST